MGSGNTNYLIRFPRPGAIMKYVCNHNSYLPRESRKLFFVQEKTHDIFSCSLSCLFRIKQFHDPRINMYSKFTNFLPYKINDSHGSVNRPNSSDWSVLKTWGTRRIWKAFEGFSKLSLRWHKRTTSLIYSLVVSYQIWYLCISQRRFFRVTCWTVCVWYLPRGSMYLGDLPRF